jgi:hypothetical protein
LDKTGYNIPTIEIPMTLSVDEEESMVEGEESEEEEEEEEE